MKRYEHFGDDLHEGKIYRVRFTDLLEWVLQVPTSKGKREGSTEEHLEMVQRSWVYERKDNRNKDMNCNVADIT